ncbi:hypothetical protein BKA69DRAFT_1093958 [Paraphysoderma sedebokerense]|nr:hypothetical protein BKA69DRAFT_1093958 [Paraphysoderma sedebokerense]
MNAKQILIIFALLALSATVSAQPVEAIAVAGPGESVTVINDNGKVTTNRGGSNPGTQNTRRPASNTRIGVRSLGANGANAVSSAGPGEFVENISRNINGRETTKTTRRPIRVRV